MERWFETFLWQSRLLVLVAVVVSLVSSAAVFFIATADAWYLLSHLGEYLDPGLLPDARKALRAGYIAHVVEVIDGYLLGAVLLIFSLGLYELFISAIDPARGSRLFGKVLMIDSLDDLKGRLGKVVLMILIVKFFEHGIGMKFEGPLDLLAFAAGITLIGVALWLSHVESRHRDTGRGRTGEEKAD